MDPFAPGLLDRLTSPRRVAIVRALRIGDVICATPAFRSLKQALPDAEITLIGLPFVRELVARSPHLDHFVEFPGFPGMAEQFFDARRTTRFFKEMQAHAFDLAIQMHGSGVYSNPFTLLLGAGATAGFVRPGDSAGRLDAALPFPEGGHEVRRPLVLATFLGAPNHNEATEFPLLMKDHREAEELLNRADFPLIGLHPAARDATKRWALDRFAKAGIELQKNHGGTVVVLGGRDEPPLAQTVADMVGEKCLNLAGKTNLGVLGAVIARLAVLVTNDSGPAHVAYALRTPTVTIFGGTDPSVWGPPAGSEFRVVVNPVSCWPCTYLDCPIGYNCLEGISVEKVVEKASEVLKRQ